MKFTKVEKNGTTCAVVQSSEKVIIDVQSSLDLLINAKYEAGTKILRLRRN